MAAIKDIYEIIKELMEVAKKVQDKEVSALVADIFEKYFDIKEEISDIKDENRKLRNKVDELEKSKIIEEDLELTEEGWYIKKTEKNKGKDIKYCPVCWGSESNLIPIISDSLNEGRMRCHKCNTLYLTNEYKRRARNCSSRINIV